MHRDLDKRCLGTTEAPLLPSFAALWLPWLLAEELPSQLSALEWPGLLSCGSLNTTVPALWVRPTLAPWSGASDSRLRPLALPPVLLEPLLVSTAGDGCCWMLLAHEKTDPALGPGGGVSQS